MDGEHRVAPADSSRLAEPTPAGDGNSSKPNGGIGRAVDYTTVAVAVLALLVSVVSAVYTYFDQRTQAHEAQLTELRGLYPRIAILQSLAHPTNAQSSELFAETGIAAAILRDMHYDATGADMYFIAQAYAHSGVPISALALYQEAVSHATEVADATSALRGSAHVKADLGDAAGVDADLRRAIAIAHGELTGATRVRSEAKTQGWWVMLDDELHRCADARKHFAAYRNLKIGPRLPNSSSSSLSDVRGYLTSACA